MSAKKKNDDLKQIYQIKITLSGVKPPIWRRIEVLSDITLGKLHQIFQTAMGWENYHLHQFIIKNVFYGQSDPNYAPEMQNENLTQLSQVINKEKTKFAYEYDFGDGWLHDILLEKILPIEKGKHYPICIKGKRACPPEDVGGSWGYADFLEAINDDGHSEHNDMLEWAGDFDSERFDIEEINDNLRQI